MFETTVAVQIAAKALWRNGAHAEAATRGNEVVGGSGTAAALAPRELDKMTVISAMKG
jgi:hypothetical protein